MQCLITSVEEFYSMNFIEVIFVLGFAESLILFLYAIRWYIFSFVSLKSSPIEVSNDLDCNLNSCFVSVLLPTYNEPNVVDRLLRACTSFNLKYFEVIVVDDSNDGVKSFFMPLVEGKIDPDIEYFLDQEMETLLGFSFFLLDSKLTCRGSQKHAVFSHVGEAVNGAGLRLLSCRSSRVRTPPPAPNTFVVGFLLGDF